jgi:hypothetical protein
MWLVVSPLGQRVLAGRSNRLTPVEGNLEPHRSQVNPPPACGLLLKMLPMTMAQDSGSDKLN